MEATGGLNKAPVQLGQHHNVFGWRVVLQGRQVHDLIEFYFSLRIIYSHSLSKAYFVRTQQIVLPVSVNAFPAISP